MNINQNNYEEFFILYWDNELTAEQRKMVEHFVEENKDLQEDFCLFGETRIVPDVNLTYQEKDLLKNAEGSLINFSNYPEQLLSFIDDELNPDQKKTVELFAAKHPVVQQELSVFQKTKLKPESEITFPDKSVLYRKEEKVSVIKMYWMRVAVAAALILVAGLVSLRVINNNTNEETPELVSTESSVNPQATQPLTNQQPKAEPLNEKPAIAKSIIKKETQKLPKENFIAKNRVDLNKENKNNLPKEKISIDEPLIAQNSTTNPSIEPAVPEMSKTGNAAIALTKLNKKIDFFENSSVTERPSPSYAIYDASIESKKNVDNGGLKGLLRKATRIFERRTNMQATTDDNKLLVGVFAVSLK